MIYNFATAEPIPGLQEVPAIVHLRLVPPKVRIVIEFANGVRIPGRLDAGKSMIPTPHGEWLDKLAGRSIPDYYVG